MRFFATPFRKLAAGAVLCAAALGLAPHAAEAYWVRPGVVVVPAPVVVAPPPRVVYVRPYHHRWVPAHYLWNGAFVPGHWI